MMHHGPQPNYMPLAAPYINHAVASTTLSGVSCPRLFLCPRDFIAGLDEKYEYGGNHPDPENLLRCVGFT